ncbi:hypothetical protein C8R43DRAFT_1047678 [Mycena crocata]|nr:hypothetical protein C8R43DRAFT_1047678 [Mycena crocata]
MESSFPKGPRVPVELQDDIIGWLQDCEQDLRSCALAASSLRRASQSYLFRYLTIDYPVCTPLLTPEEAQASAGAAARRLREAFAASPHLGFCVLSLAAAADIQIIEQVAAMHLPNLAKMRLYDNYTYGIHGELIEPLQRLIGSPSMRCVEVCTSYFSAAIFDTCTRNLTEIGFSDAEENGAEYLPEEEEKALYLSLLQGRIPAVPRSAVTRLTLHNSAPVLDWLADMACPFDFSHLVEITLCRSFCYGLRKLLTSARETLQKITFTTVDDEDPDENFALVPQLDLGYLKALTHIHSYVMDVSGMIQLLPSISELNGDNIIQSIKFTLGSFDAEIDDELLMELIKFDTSLSRLPLPRLQEVVISLHIDHFPETQTIFRKGLPLLHRRQVLRILGKDG